MSGYYNQSHKGKLNSLLDSFERQTTTRGAAERDYDGYARELNQSASRDYDDDRLYAAETSYGQRTTSDNRQYATSAYSPETRRAEPDSYHATDVEYLRSATNGRDYKSYETAAPARSAYIEKGWSDADREESRRLLEVYEKRRSFPSPTRTSRALVEAETSYSRDTQTRDYFEARFGSRLSAQSLAVLRKAAGDRPELYESLSTLSTDQLHRVIEAYSSQVVVPAKTTASHYDDQPRVRLEDSRRQSLADEPRRAQTYLDEPRRPQPLLDEPRRSQTHDEPRRVQQVLDEPRRTQIILDEPRRPQILIDDPIYIERYRETRYRQEPMREEVRYRDVLPLTDSYRDDPTRAFESTLGYAGSQSLGGSGRNQPSSLLNDSRQGGASYGIRRGEPKALLSLPEPLLRPDEARRGRQPVKNRVSPPRYLNDNQKRPASTSSDRAQKRSTNGRPANRERDIGAKNRTTKPAPAPIKRFNMSAKKTAASTDKKPQPETKKAASQEKTPEVIIIDDKENETVVIDDKPEDNKAESDEAKKPEAEKPEVKPEAEKAEVKPEDKPKKGRSRESSERRSRESSEKRRAKDYMITKETPIINLDELKSLQFVIRNFKKQAQSTIRTLVDKKRSTNDITGYYTDISAALRQTVGKKEPSLSRKQFILRALYLAVGEQTADALIRSNRLEFLKVEPFPKLEEGLSLTAFLGIKPLIKSDGAGKKDEKKDVYNCYMCETKYNALKEYKDHMNSDEHKKMAKSYEQSSKPNQEKKSASKYCEFCQHKFSSDARDHFNNDEHKRNQTKSLLQCEMCQVRTFRTKDDFMAHCETGHHVENLEKLGRRTDIKLLDGKNADVPDFSSTMATGYNFIYPTLRHYCSLCRLFVPVGDAAMKLHCTTRYHYNQYKMAMSITELGQQAVQTLAEGKATFKQQIENYQTTGCIEGDLFVPMDIPAEPLKLAENPMGEMDKPMEVQETSIVDKVLNDGMKLVVVIEKLTPSEIIEIDNRIDTVNTDSTTNDDKMETETEGSTPAAAILVQDAVQPKVAGEEPTQPDIEQPVISNIPISDATPNVVPITDAALDVVQTVVDVVPEVVPIAEVLAEAVVTAPAAKQAESEASVIQNGDDSATVNSNEKESASAVEPIKEICGDESALKKNEEEELLKEDVVVHALGEPLSQQEEESLLKDDMEEVESASKSPGSVRGGRGRGRGGKAKRGTPRGK